MKTTICLLFCLITLFSCNIALDKKETKLTDTVRVFVPADTGFASMDYIFKFTQQLAPDFYFDTLSFEDTIYKANYDLYILQSSATGMEKFNIAIKNYFKNVIEKNKKHFDLEQVVLDSLYYHTFEAGPFEIYKDDDILSVCNIIDTYTHGASHHHYSWNTCNYDLKANKFVGFKDVFNLKNKNDSLGLIELSQRHQIGEGCMDDWHLPYDSVDFSFNRLGIIINPELSWACGMQRSFISYDNLQSYLHEEWMKNL